MLRRLRLGIHSAQKYETSLSKDVILKITKINYTKHRNEVRVYNLTCAQELIYVEDRGQCQVLPQLLSTLLFETGSLLSLVLTVLARPTGKQASDLLISISQGCAVTPSSACGCWGSEVRSSDLNAKHFTN